MSRNLLALFSCLSLSLLASCGGPRMVTELTVSEMDYTLVESNRDFSLSLPEYYEWMVKSGLVASGGVVSSEDGRKYLDSMLIDTLNSIKAVALNLRQQRKFYRTYLLRYHALLQNEFLVATIMPQVDLDSQDVFEYYSAHASEYELPEQVLVHHVLISPDALLASPDSVYYRTSPPEILAQAAESLAYVVYDELTVQGRPFAEVAVQYSHDSDVRLTAGFVGWSIRNMYEPPFDSVAFGTEPGTIAKPYRDSNGWHVLRVEDYWKGGPPPLKDSLYLEVADKVLGGKVQEKSMHLRDSLSYDLNLTYHDSILDTNTFKVDDWEWAAVLNDRDTIFFYHLKAMEQQYRSMYAVPETDVRIKREMIRAAAFELRVVQAAQDMKIDTLPEMAAAERDLRFKYSKACVEEAMGDPLWTPTDSMIEAYYDSHVNDFKVEKPLTVQHIIVADSVTGAFVADQARAGHDFLTLANQFYVGDPEMRTELANLGSISQDDVPPEFWSMAARMLPGDVSDPVKSKLGFHVIKLLEARFTPTVDKVRSEIIKVLKDQHALEVVDNYKAELYREFGIRVVGEVPPMHLKPLRLRSEGA